jgi:succinate dehydrogenase flavin-adding protein (antitoxin of CptAB toxin-antitoxin module)
MDQKNLLLKKLHYRSNYRGCKETDVLLGKFFNEKFEEFSEDELQIYHQFLQEDDALIYDWLMDKDLVKEPYQELVKKIQYFHKIEITTSLNL